MKRAIAYASLMALVVAVAAVFRLPDLGNRPMHCDEAVHGIKFGRLLEHGDYRYDPDEYHGPTLNYFTLLVARCVSVSRLTEVTEIHLRIVTALFGTALVAATALLTIGIGRGAALLAACLVAVSPSLVFYSRYYIQETLLVFFTTVALGALWHAALDWSPAPPTSTAAARWKLLFERRWLWACRLRRGLGPDARDQRNLHHSGSCDARRCRSCLVATRTASYRKKRLRPLHSRVDYDSRRRIGNLFLVLRSPSSGNPRLVRDICQLPVSRRR